MYGKIYLAVHFQKTNGSVNENTCFKHPLPENIDSLDRGKDEANGQLVMFDRTI